MAADIFQIYKGKKVLITGHTGFKGGWLSQWLVSLDSDVYGIALPPEGEYPLFRLLDLEDQMTHHICDIRQFEQFKQKIDLIRPDVIFHLAAQPLVRESYRSPLSTVQTNVMGTVHLMEIIRELKLPTTVIIITSDKCYQNKEWLFGYRESDPMGGYDPYSSSKGASEILSASWRSSFFNPVDYESHGVRLSTVRAGNVIGGGDWSKDRIVPDCMRALLGGQPIEIRNPLSTRPWQHVLEPLGGYLLLGSRMLNSSEQIELEKYCDAFNFGPLIASNRTVQDLADEIIRNWGTGRYTYNKQHAVHEASLLNLSIDKAYQLLDWYPVWDFEETVRYTVDWYRLFKDNPGELRNLTLKQIREYSDSFMTNK